VQRKSAAFRPLWRFDHTHQKPKLLVSAIIVLLHDVSATAPAGFESIPLISTGIACFAVDFWDARSTRPRPGFDIARWKLTRRRAVS
jgi:hypothetical protein